MPEVFTSKWHVKLLRPAICDRPACMVYEIFDAMAPNPGATLVVAAIPFVCAGHAVGTDAGQGTLRWMDGNFKDLADYIDYQKQYFFYINNQEWQTRVADGDIPRPWDRPAMTSAQILEAQRMPTIKFRGVSKPLADWGVEPVTTGSVTPPSLEEIIDLDQVYSWVMEHDDRLMQTHAMMKVENSDYDRRLAVATWTSTGATRVMHINSNGQLSSVEQSKVQNIADIQFGPGKVMVDG